MRSKKPVCITCGKRKPLIGRGKCSACYQAHDRLVKLGRTTYAELEKKGVSLPTGNKNITGSRAYQAAVGRK